MNRWGSSGGGGVICEVELNRCRLARVDFLGAMEVDLWSRFAKIARKTRGETEGVAKKTLEGKRSATRVYIGPKYLSLRRGKECLCGGIDTFVVVYPKVGKGLHSGIGCYVTAD